MEDTLAPSTLRKSLLACGIVSSLLYIAMNILGPMQFEGYSPVRVRGRGLGKAVPRLFDRDPPPASRVWRLGRQIGILGVV